MTSINRLRELVTSGAGPLLQIKPGETPISDFCSAHFIWRVLSVSGPDNEGMVTMKVEIDVSLKALCEPYDTKEWCNHDSDEFDLGYFEHHPPYEGKWLDTFYTSDEEFDESFSFYTVNRYQEHYLALKTEEPYVTFLENLLNRFPELYL